MDDASRSSETTNNCASATYRLCVSNIITAFIAKGKFDG